VLQLQAGRPRLKDTKLTDHVTDIQLQAENLQATVTVTVSNIQLQSVTITSLKCPVKHNLGAESRRLPLSISLQTFLID
jgi:hypothetical protein